MLTSLPFAIRDSSRFPKAIGTLLDLSSLLSVGIHHRRQRVRRPAAAKPAGQVKTH